jgi:hypothetical protein
VSRPLTDRRPVTNRLFGNHSAGFARSPPRSAVNVPLGLHRRPARRISIFVRLRLLSATGWRHCGAKHEPPSVPKTPRLFLTPSQEPPFSYNGPTSCETACCKSTTCVVKMSFDRGLRGFYERIKNLSRKRRGHLRADGGAGPAGGQGTHAATESRTASATA